MSFCVNGLIIRAKILLFRLISSTKRALWSSVRQFLTKIARLPSVSVIFDARFATFFLASDDVPEQVIKDIKLHIAALTQRSHHPAQRGVVIHRCSEREGARSAYEIVATRQQTQVFAGIAVGERYVHTLELAAELVAVERGVVAADEDAHPTLLLLGKPLDVVDIHVITEVVASALPSAVVATPYVYTQHYIALTGVGKQVVYMIFYGAVKGKELLDFPLVLEEEVVVSHLPTLYHQPVARVHQALGFGIVAHMAKGGHRQQTDFGSQLSQHIYHEVVVTGVADVEVGILVGKPHRHRTTPMLSCPGIYVAILQDIIAHTALVSYK